MGSTDSFETIFEDIKPEIKADNADNAESSAFPAQSDAPENSISGDALADANPSPDTKVT